MFFSNVRRVCRGEFSICRVSQDWSYEVAERSVAQLRRAPGEVDLQRAAGAVSGFIVVRSGSRGETRDGGGEGQVIMGQKPKEKVWTRVDGLESHSEAQRNVGPAVVFFSRYKKRDALLVDKRIRPRSA